MLKMIVGIFLRHIKTYKGINFIPLSDGEKFCGLVGNNGIGKSTVLEALEKIFLQDKDWNINLGHNQSTDDTNVLNRTGFVGDFFFFFFPPDLTG